MNQSYVGHTRTPCAESQTRTDLHCLIAFVEGCENWMFQPISAIRRLFLDVPRVGEFSSGEKYRAYSNAPTSMPRISLGSNVRSASTDNRPLKHSSPRNHLHKSREGSFHYERIPRNDAFPPDS